ncbi:hypothetical protein TNCV_3691001 [Trichonephila clavipes]|nr:hypothetical protein TNCV_3691001 [Trichonephila clavipes]
MHEQEQDIKLESLELVQSEDRTTVERLFYEENRERFKVPGKSSLHRKIRNIESLVYADKPQTLDHLEDNIRRVIADIRPQMLEKVIENWTSRLDYIRASRGRHMAEIIFKM